MHKLKELRIERKWTQAELAERAGLAHNTVVRAEKGLPVRVDTRRKLLTVLGVPYSEHAAIFGPLPDWRRKTEREVAPGGDGESVAVGGVGKPKLTERVVTFPSHKL